MSLFCVCLSALKLTSDRNARVETVLMFAQGVYLMFSSFYVCKETFEHLLLSAGNTGGAEGHHHHHGDEDGEWLRRPLRL